MLSKKLLVAASVFVTALAVTAVVVSHTGTLKLTKGSATEKTFIFDSTVASQVPYDGGAGPYTRSVTTGISSNIDVKLYREAGDGSETTNRDGCFYGANYSNRRTFTFEAGLNNLIGFEIQFRYSYDASFDGDKTHFNYTVDLTFYNKKTVVHTKQYSLSDTTRNTTYTHTWEKEPEILDKITNVKCSLANGGGGSKDDWRVLKILYYKVIWSC